LRDVESSVLAKKPKGLQSYRAKAMLKLKVPDFPAPNYFLDNDQVLKIPAPFPIPRKLSDNPYSYFLHEICKIESEDNEH